MGQTKPTTTKRVKKMKKGLILMALCLCFAAVTVSADIVWSSAFDFDGTPTTEPIVLDADTPILYSSELRDNPNQCDATAIIVSATSQQHPVYVADIYHNNALPMGAFTGTTVWNFKDSQYNNFPKNDTYTLKEVIYAEDWDYQTTETTLTRTITLAPEPSLIVALGLVGALLIRRRKKYVLAVLLLATIGSFNAWAGGTVTSVSCQQAWPLSRKVLITFSWTVDSFHQIYYYGTTDNGATTFNLRDKGTMYCAPSTAMMSGTTTAIWEPDSTFDSVKGKIKIGVELVDPYADPDGISDASPATKDQYKYISSIPSGRWSDICEKMKANLKLVPAETYTKESSSEEKGREGDIETQHQVTLRKSSYDNVFEVAQEQYL